MGRQWISFGVLFVAWTAFLLSFVGPPGMAPDHSPRIRYLSITAAQAGGYMTAFYIDLRDDTAARRLSDRSIRVTIDGCR